MKASVLALALALLCESCDIWYNGLLADFHDFLKVRFTRESLCLA